jgi:guanylate kinase
VKSRRSVNRPRTSSEAEPRGIPIVLSGPAGAGKTVIADAAVKREDRLVLSVSATSRPKRPGETDGEDYHFLSREEFEGRIEAGELLEYTEHLGNLYGTLRDVLEKGLEAGRDVLLTLDVHGGDSIRAAFPQSVLIFLLPPSMEILERRLRERGRDPEEEIRRRLEVAASELRHAGGYDYLVTNDEFGEAVDGVLAVVKAERLRRERIQSVLMAAGILPRDLLPFRSLPGS